MICSRCGKELPDGSAFCNSCGSPLIGASRPLASDAKNDDNIRLDFHNQNKGDLFDLTPDRNEGAVNNNSADYDFGTFADGIEIDEAENESHRDRNDPSNKSSENDYDNSYRKNKKKNLLWLWIALGAVAIAVIAAVAIIVINNSKNGDAVAESTTDEASTLPSETEIREAVDEPTPDEASTLPSETEIRETEIETEIWETEIESETEFEFIEATKAEKELEN